MKFAARFTFVIWLGWIATTTAWGADTNHNYSVWEKAITAYERADATNPTAKGSIVFIGSSTIARWKTLAQDFAGAPVLNRGFGGSEIVDSTHFAPRVIFPYAPKAVFLRAGGNDLWAGKSVAQVFTDFQDFATTIHAKLPTTKIFYIALSPSIARWNQHEKEKELNRLVADWSKDKPHLEYIETYDIALGPDGKPREDLFVADKLHFNAEGYKLLAARVRPFVESVQK
jgi:lysophospholipase L1-like esterase